MSVCDSRNLATRDNMQLFVPCTLILLFSIQCLCTYRPAQGEKLDEVSDNRNALECLETLISVRHWAVNDFLIISDGMDVVDGNFFQRFSNIRWKLHSVRNNELTGFSNVIFFARNFDSFKATISEINIRRMDSRTHFVISVAKNFASLNEIKIASKEIPTTMWKLDKTRVVYLVPCKKDIFAMTYFPFAENCQVGELEVLDIWRGKDFVKGAELFPEKMLDIRGCVQNHSIALPKGSVLQLRAEFTEAGEMILGGVGGRLITIVAEKMNMKLHAVLQPPDSWPLLASQIVRGESLFSIAGTIPLVGQSEVLDLDYGYMEESFGLGYNVDGFEVSWKNLARPLSKEVWQYIGYVGLLFCGLLLMANRCHHSEITSDKLWTLRGFGIFLGVTQALPRSYFGRYLFGMWIVYSYLINVAYNSGLVSFLTNPNERRIINTLEELLADGLDFGGGTFHREFYHDPSDPVMMKVYNNFKIWSDDESLDRLVTGKGVTGVLKSYVSLYNSNQSDTNNRKFHMLKEKAFTYHPPIPMRRGSPFTLGVRRYTSRAIQGGFNVYWLKYYTHKSSSAGIRDNNGPTVISIQHIRGILYFYITGLISCSMIFLGELMFHKYLQNRRACSQPSHTIADPGLLQIIEL